MKRVIFTKQFNHLTLFARREEHREIAYYSSPTTHPVFPSHGFYLSFLCCSLLRSHTVCRSQRENQARLGEKLPASDLKQTEMRLNQTDSILFLSYHYYRKSLSLDKKNLIPLFLVLGLGRIW